MSLTPRVLGVAALVARRGGRAAALALAAEARDWLADPANEPARARATAGLRDLAGRAGTGAGRAVDLVASEVERRRSRAGDWERELLRRRYAAVDTAPGPAREAAVDAYLVQAGLARRVVDGAPDRHEARRRVVAALGAEERMMRRERLSADDRARGLAALAGARRAVHGPAR